MSTIGFAFLLLGLSAAAFSDVTFIFWTRSGNAALLTGARRGLYGACGFLTAAVTVLFIALLTHNYSLEYVASYTSNSTELGYLISALWAGNAGSLLFWAWLTSVFAVIVVVQRRNTNQDLVPYASAVMMFTLVFFLILIIFEANPFQELSVAPLDGLGLNPMLENPGMVIHPPVLLAGYVGLVVPFAFAIAALVRRKMGNEWLGAIRRWTLFAWLLLGVGNLIGALWAYVELGWGGYWVWDPVENAGLMPWLLSTAFLHSIMIQRRKGMFRFWSVILAVTTFCLVIFGTFLTRTGFVSSVHTFSNSTMSLYFIGFLAAIIIGPIALIISRRQALNGDGEVEKFVSREGTFLINNLLLVGSTLVVFTGTMFSPISELFTGNKIEVGPSFYNTVNGPLFMGIILLMGICTLISWRPIKTRAFLNKLLWPAIAAVVVGAILVLVGVRNWYAVGGSFICALALGAILFQWLSEGVETRRAVGVNLLTGLGRALTQNKPRYGAYIVHISIAIIAIGVIGSSLYDVERTVSLAPGQSIVFEGYTFTYGQLNLKEIPDRQIVSADVSVLQNERLIKELSPQKIFYPGDEHPVSEVAIRSTLAQDIYIILAGWSADGTASFAIRIIPLVIWIWIGGGTFLIGALLALWPGRLGQPTARAIVFTIPETAANLDEDIESRVRELSQSQGRFCSQCGTPSKPDDRFCANCGTDMRRK